MSCTTTRELLSAYVDGELSPAQVAEVTAHLTSCEACAQTYEDLLGTVRRVREGLAKYRAPDVLRARVRTALREHDPAEAPDVASAPAPIRRTLPWRLVAAVLVTAIASSAATRLALSPRSSAPELPAQVLASHIRSLMPDHLTDVESNDTHNVKPWFNGRLDFSPNVPRLEESGFPLLGGRVDYVNERPVAVVVYARRKHMINVFSWPADAGSDSRASLESRHGYNLMHWRRAGVENWVASDLNVAELRQFTQLLQGTAPPAPGQQAPPGQ